MTDWKPMHTAPKDGTLILAYGDKLVFGQQGKTYGVCWWVRTDYEWWEQVSENRKVRRTEESGYWDGSDVYPDCWQPLPEPPNQNIERERRQ